MIVRSFFETSKARAPPTECPTRFAAFCEHSIQATKRRPRLVADAQGSVREAEGIQTLPDFGAERSHLR
ncbi:protein of unknown function [Pararobbsia alpina]